MAASILLAAALSSGSTWIALRAPQGDQTAIEIVDGHVRSLMSQRPTDVTSSERHTVKPWFNGRIPQAPQVLDLSAAHVTDHIEARESPENWNFPYLTELWDGASALKQARG